jgi:Undecaprenyl-phosphate glucose phosphotransferase
VGIGRLALGTVERRLRERGTLAQRLIIVGGGSMAQRVLDGVQSTLELGYRVVGFVADDVPTGNIKGLPVLGPTDEIGSIVDRVYPDEVIIALPEASHQEILSLISRCEKGGVSIKVFPDVFQALASEVSIDTVGELPLVTVRDIALRGWKLTLKRAVDLVISAIVLVFLSPLMLAVALLIKLDSRGPVFFTQERMGLDARPFQIVKFRSMRADAEESGPGWTVRDDPRRTRLGRIIRRLSIDELPQLVNVLVGDMSMVGPRAEQPAFVEQFMQVVPRYMERHKEKAGLTGWAQINGLRGDTSIAERTRFDLYYIENWSLLLDLKIMLKTIPHLLRDDHAY